MSQDPDAVGGPTASKSAAATAAAAGSGGPGMVGRLAPGYARTGELDDPTAGVEAAFRRYRFMAYVVGVGLATLVFVGVPLQFGAGYPQVDSVVGVIHGFLYIVYLLVAVDLARRARFTMLQMAAMIGAGFIPLLAFVIEHRVHRRLTEELGIGSQGTPEAT